MCLSLTRSVAVNGSCSVREVKMTFIAVKYLRTARRLLLLLLPRTLSVFTLTMVLLLLQSLLLVSVSASSSSSSSPSVDSSSPAPHRKADLLFHSSTSLHGRMVTCDNSSDSEYKFPAATWSCYNMRIDGLRLRSYYTLKSSSHCTDDVKGINDLGALCRELLGAHNIRGDLWAALIVKNPSCGNSEGERMMFLKSNKSSNQSFQWVRYQAGKGYVHTLRCMLK